MRKCNPVRIGCQAFTIILFLIFFPQSLYAQRAVGEAAWIFFAQKNSTVPAQIPESTKERRLQRAGTQGPVWYDFPVDTAYLDGLKSCGANIRVVSRWLNAVSVETDPAAIERISKLPYVIRISRVSSYSLPISLPTAPLPTGRARPSAFNYGPSALQVSMLDIDSLHNAGLSGHDIKIGIMDTGFDTSHVAFARMTSENRVLATRNFISGGDDVMGLPDDGQRRHGTEVLSVIGGFQEGNIVGTAFGAGYVLAKTEILAQEIRAEEDYWVGASEWMESLGVDIISSSLGYIDWYDTTQLNGQTAIITQAANIANQLGVVVVNSAGNEGDNIRWRKVTPPADGDSVIAAGAVDADELVASFSSRGPTVDGRIKPDFCALGVGDFVAVSETGGYGSESGTSFSAPLLAGGVALLLEGHPQWKLVDIITNLKRASSNTNTPNNASGWGVPDFVDAFYAESFAPKGSRLLITPQPAIDSVIFSMQLVSAGTARLSVHDLSGAKVQEWEIAVASPSVVTQVWDGRNHSGEKIASGIYICVLKTGDATVRQKLAYLSR